MGIGKALGYSAVFVLGMGAAYVTCDNYDSKEDGRVYFERTSRGDRIVIERDTPLGKTLERKIGELGRTLERKYAGFKKELERKDSLPITDYEKKR